MKKKGWKFICKKKKKVDVQRITHYWMNIKYVKIQRGKKANKIKIGEGNEGRSSSKGKTDREDRKSTGYSKSK
jgi:hypothetical protein